jgi:hypothetical protein
MENTKKNSHGAKIPLIILLSIITIFTFILLFKAMVGK